MADTNPAASGTSTSEFKLATLAVIIGTALQGVSGVLISLQEAGFAAPWIPVVLAVVGVLLQIASVLGYTSSRAAVKTALIDAQARGLAAAVVARSTAPKPEDVVNVPK